MLYLIILIVIILLASVSKNYRVLLPTLDTWKNRIDNNPIHFLYNVVSISHNIDFDIYTLRQVRQKMKVLDVDNFKELYARVKKRADPDNFRQIIVKKSICENSKYMAVLESLVLWDEDPILFLPFFNENIIKEEIRETIRRNMLTRPKNEILKEVFNDYRQFPFVKEYLLEF